MAEDDPQDIEAARTRVAVLCRRLEARTGRPVRLLETHISWLLLTADEAFKLKKPLRLPFLDAASLQARRRFCEEELRLNRRLAESIYREVVEVRMQPDGDADFGGDGPVVDVAVRMRRFADGCLWSERVAAGTLQAADVDAMARRLAAFHRDAEVLPASSRFGSAEVQRRVTGRLLDAQQARAGGPTPDERRLHDWLLAEMARLAGFWEQRRHRGRVRECHGDLHLANLLQEQGQPPAAFDAVEFDPELRCIDVVDDIAFVVMDLLAHGCSGFAWRFLDGYLQAGGDHEGLPALRFYMVRRALVRALVRDLSASIGAPPTGACDADRYRALAAALASPAAPWLAITHGLPASGKSRAALELLQRAAAIRLRSDVERKRLSGLDALESSRGIGDIYTEAVTAQTYLRLYELAGIALTAGWPVVVDAAFLRRSERQRFAALARSLGLRFVVVDCRAAPQVLRDRIVRRLQRADDPSEADLAVLERLGRVDEPLDPDEADTALVVDAAAPERWPAALERWLSQTAART